MRICYTTQEDEGAFVPRQNYNKGQYEERLRRLVLPTLKYRRIRGDMIELYKIFMLKYESDITLKTRPMEMYTETI